MNKLKGFTLAEMVITLGIIGVIAAIVTPILKNAKPNEEMIMLKKAYFNTARIVSEMINDEDLYPEYDEEAEQSGFSNTSKAVYNGKEFKSSSKFCGIFAEKLNVGSAANCNARVGVSSGGNFKTTDGIVWSMPAGNFSGKEYIVVDTNGAKKENCSLRSNLSGSVGGLSACPNKKAPDQFVFAVDKYGGLEVIGDVEKEYVLSNKTARSYENTVKCLANGSCSK